MIRYKGMDVFLYVLVLCLCMYFVKDFKTETCPVQEFGFRQVMYGDCFHSGRNYMKHTVWQPGPCTVCTCEDPIVLCETIRCTDPDCDYNKGEYLQISADSCCPECVPQLASCSYQDRSIPHNTEWNPEPCVLCFCDDGEVTCAKIPCLPTRCKSGEIIQNVPGQCCPQCIPAGRSCTYEGQSHLDGTEWEGLPCTKCICRDGQHTCYPRECPAVVCPYNERLETLPGSCCPVCQGVNSTCRERNQEYRTGEQWHRGPCTLCVCIGGTAVCTEKECMDLMICNMDHMQITRQGECCPECVPKTGVCSDVTPVRYSGDIWNVSSCEYCVCNQGIVQCHTAVCENIMCYQDELLVQLPGTCCPQCVIPPSCEFAGKSYKAGESWHPDDCSICHCDSGETVCYRQHCPICPSGSESVSVPGECCGKCQIVECDPECKDCTTSAPGNCTICSNPELYIQDGHCVQRCRMGYYASPTHVCQQCDETCYTCNQGTPYHCDMCQPGLMWKHGQCVPQCGVGYYLQNGKCLQCHSHCKSCNGPNPNQCASCSNPAQVVFLGECLNNCPDNFFIRGGNCIACHPTCKTCTPDGAGCATCWEGGLLHQGQCVARCPVGFYRNTAGSCSPCHPACETCNGGFSKNCTSCFTGGRISKKGRCRSQCPKGKYFTLEGQCQDCLSGCSDCRLSWDGSSSICSSCENKALVPSGSECIDQCTPGQFLEHKACKECGENCLTCSSPTGCTRCVPSMLLYKGLCVAHCGQGQFEDGTTMSCKACSKDCLQCYSGQECSVCTGETYLKGGYCVRDCGKGFVVDKDTRECIRNLAAPTFQVLRHIQVRPGEITPLELGMFYISDPDTPSHKLYVVLVKVPGNGNIIKAAEAVDVILKRGDNFTMSDILAGKVRFLHRKYQGEKDFATLKVTDTQLDSRTVDLYCQVITPTPLSVRAKNIIYAETGSVTPVGRDVLDLWTDRSLEDVILSVLKGPKQGSIIHQQLKVAIQAFSLKDLQTGQIAYQPDSRANPGPDSVLLQATDNYNVLTVLLEIDIRAKYKNSKYQITNYSPSNITSCQTGPKGILKSGSALFSSLTTVLGNLLGKNNLEQSITLNSRENAAPMLVQNGVGHVSLGDVLMITPDLLMAKVVDIENTETDDAIYTLVPPLNNPQDGDVVMVVPLPETGVYPGWEDMGDGTMATRMSRFLQRDINEGRIFYKHKGNAALTDTVTFEVADTASPANILTDQRFHISVRLKDSPGHPQADPALAPGIRLGITVLENQLVPITSSNLAYEDRDTVPDEIYYTITKPLGEGHGMLEHVERPFKPVRSFTQEDINNNRIIFRPPEKEIGNRETEFTFYFTVTDGQYNRSSAEQKFSIRIIPVNNMPPQFGTATPKILVSQGGSIPIGQSILQITDPDTPLSELRLTLEEVPRSGRIEKVQDGLKVTLRNGDVFSYSEFETNAFQFTSDGTATGYDTFQLSISDGEHETKATINVTIVAVDKSAPYMSTTASCRLSVVEGSSEKILRDHLSFMDNEDADNRVQITLTVETVHGKLLLYNKQVMNRGRFTQADINDGHLSFFADAEIGKRPVTEILTFNVTDSSGNVVPNQVLTVVIQPDDNQPPLVKVLSGVQVQEGGKVTLTGKEIMVTDPDTVTGNLVIVIDSKPSYGDLLDSAPAEGSEKLENRLVSSFPVQDLINGYISYVQSDHKNKEPVRDHFLFHATDGKNKSPVQSLNISINLTNDEAPVLVAEQVFVKEGQAVTVTNASVYVTDIDTKPGALTLTIVTPPTHGVLRRKSSRRVPVEAGAILLKETSFSYQDILNDLIVYQSDGSEVTTDSFTLHLSDGDFEDTKTVSVIIGLVNDETPRVMINRGLSIQAGSTRAIKSEDLRSTDVDSDDAQLTYTLTQDPPHGRLLLVMAGKEVALSKSGPQKTFTQMQINNGHLLYRHRSGEGTGTVIFKFTVSDRDGNDLIDQHFYITVLEDRYSPKPVSVNELVVTEGGKTTITTEFLSFTDDDTEPASLTYLVLQPPQLGHLQLSNEPDVPISEFTQSDLASNSVIYIHTSTEETYMDSFTFSVSDGPHDVIRTLSISISPVDDSIPVVVNNGLKVQEGVRKLITEFDLKATDKDTKEDLLLFTITKPPLHGNIEIHYGNSWSPATVFSMTDIYENHISYLHDGTETVTDNFSFTVSDGTNSNFAAMQQDSHGNHAITQTEPQEFSIDILPLDDGSPVIEVNIGLQFLEYTGSEISNIISANELRATDTDTPADKIMYVITDAPQLGRLEKTDKPGTGILSFSQEDIDNGIIKYVLTTIGSDVTQDGFTFNLLDSKPNRVPGNSFHITWSVLSFEQALFNVTETAGVIQVPIKRTGNMKQYSIVTCHTVAGRAKSVRQGTRPGQQDYVEFTGQVQFDEWQDSKVCTIIINDDSVFEGPEEFYVELQQPTFALLGETAKATVAIYDLEDEPVLEFSDMEYHVEESDGYATPTIVRSGDVSSSVSVICSTIPLTARGSPQGRLESGSDYISRGNTNSYRVVFPAGVTMATCDVKLVDDSTNEATEQFEVELSSPSYGSKLGSVSKAAVLIDGPNDESSIYFSDTVYHFQENAGIVDIEIVREGTDLSHSSMVWCATRLSSPPSATPGQDYIPSSSQLTFGPGQTTQNCQLTIMDDNMNPVLEGNETFTVFLSSAIGSSLVQPFIASVVIQDDQLDVPEMEFGSDKYTIAEQNKSISVPVYRHGDLSYQSSVICYTRQQTAQVMMDYDERILSEESRIIFQPGDRVKNCTVGIVDDDSFETDEVFLLKLAQPLGTEKCEARVGAVNSTNITITNPEDVPRVHFEKPAYSVQEPSAGDQITTVTIKIMRLGDISKTAEVRCSTQDGSAMSGVDYNPKSQILYFKEGVRKLDFKVDVLYNSDIEWHEAFSIILGPTPPVGAELGTVHTATITILDNDVSGSIVLPTAPIVVSLLKYDDAGQGIKVNPSPGYPVVCVTPCDIHYPTYSLTHSLCQESSINQSAMYYRWEVAMPESKGSRPPFVEISDNTLFTSVNKMVLDSVYFRPSFRIRCIAQPLDDKGNPGIPLKSKPVTIGRDNGICKTPVFTGLPFSYQAQSFLASLDYIGTDDPVHPNTIHISIQIPHQDGMLPLISTFPLHNLRFLLAEPVYRQQHVCSNIITPKERSPFLKSGFLESKLIFPANTQSGFDFPYQFDTSLRENKTLLLYKHLNLKTCVWKFDAWYHMTDLVDLCGGHAVSDFQVTNGGQTYLTVRVPLHVSYLYAIAPIGWGSLEHRTEMEFSFYYDTVLWKTGLETGGQLGGKLQVMRILIGDNGKLVIDFKTNAKFRGLFVLEHHTLPGYKSRVVVDSSVVSFDLDLVWGQNTFDGPHQLWRASSDYSLKDYTGEYTVELIPCTVQPTQGYTIQSPIPCTAHQPQRFTIPIAFQQTNRPVPLEYTLNTHFQLHNNEMMFLQNPFTSVYEFDDMDFSGAFSEGQKLYGRVLWSPEQDLKSAYKLSIEKVFICAGRDGFIPTYDPTGNIYSDGPQFGCIQPGPKLRYRFMILDKGNPDVTTKQFQNIPFNAEFADDNSNYAMITTMNGVDGFVLDVDPLYKVTSGYQWHIQVIYTIGPADSNTQQYRRKRSALYTLAKNRRDIADNLNKVYDWIETNGSKNGTNIKVLHLNYSHIENTVIKRSGSSFNSTAVLLPIIIVIVIILAILVLFLIFRKRRKKRNNPAKINNLDAAQQNSFIYKGNQNIVKCGGKDVELKNTTVYKGHRGKKPTVRVKDVNLHSNRRDIPGTEV